MSYMPLTRVLLRGFGLYPHKSITKTGFLDTLRIIVTSFPLWFVMLTSYAYSNANLHTADINIITDTMYTNFIFTMMSGNYILMAIRKFDIRKLIDDIENIVKERKLYDMVTKLSPAFDCDFFKAWFFV